MSNVPQPILTVPQLLHAALGGPDDRGPHRCFFCGAACGGRHLASEYVLESFTGRNDVAAPGSPYVCGGCVLCLRESCAVDMIDGTRGRVVTKAAMRAFSWVITPGAAQAAGKAHLGELRAACLSPPSPPFAIVLSDSGKKHLLYRGVVSHGREAVTLTLEGQAVVYRPVALAERLELCGRLIAAAGKPALAEPPSVRLAIAVCDRFPDVGESLISQWEAVRGEPLSRLAAWLSAGMDEQRQHHPARTAPPGRGGVPPQAGGPDRPGVPAGNRRRKGGGETGRGPLLFDPGPPVR